MDEARDAGPGTPSGAADRLGSWKEIATYLKRDVTTVQRWEKREGMPVHRHQHDRLGTVYAYRHEIDAWLSARRPAPSPSASDPSSPRVAAVVAARPDGPPPSGRAVRPRGAVVAALLGVLALVATDAARVDPVDDVLAGASYETLTDFGGGEQGAAISRDGRAVAFLSDRDGPMDVWLTQVGSGQFHNLTGGRVRELVNTSVRTLGFTPDGTRVTFWVRSGPRPEDIDTWAVPLSGGAPQPYLQDAAELAWAPAGPQIAFHTAGPGDPLFIAPDATTSPGPAVLVAPPGEHAHFPTWSPDGRALYVVQGALPNRLDVWRLPATGGRAAAERVTYHQATVSHPTFVGDGLLLYLVGAADGEGGEFHVLDVARRATRRLPLALARFTSAAASADGRRVVATLSRPHASLWRVPLDRPDAAPEALPVPAGRVATPRLGRDAVLYVASGTAGDVIWKLAQGTPTQIWKGNAARVLGLDVDRGGTRVAFTAQQEGRTRLYVMDVNGTGVREIPSDLPLHGGPAWTPDGTALACGAGEGAAAALVRLALDGAPTTIARGMAVDPAWSEDGQLVAFTGADVGTSFPLLTAGDGVAAARPAISLARGARRLRFVAGDRRLVTLRGELRHKDLWLTDLASGAERRLTTLPADFQARDFDVSPDGRYALVQRVEDRSDIVLIERPRP